MVALRFLVPSVGVQIPVSLPLLRTFRFLRSVFFLYKIFSYLAIQSIKGFDCPIGDFPRNTQRF